jgi:hypothetical protein
MPNCGCDRFAIRDVDERVRDTLAAAAKQRGRSLHGVSMIVVAAPCQGWPTNRYSAYVAAAVARGCMLVTADRKLAGASGIECAVELLERRDSGMNTVRQPSL